MANDTTTGELIPIYERIGLFDRKMRIVNENCDNDEEWLKWSLRALKLSVVVIQLVPLGVLNTFALPNQASST